MTGSIPFGLLLAGAVVLMLSRPLVEASRLPASVFLVLGVALGPFLRDLLPWPLLALASGWLILDVAGAWDLATLRRATPGRILLAAAGVGLAMALLVWVMAPVGPQWIRRLVLPLAAAGLALDPEAARRWLATAARPGTVDRLAPARATVALGCALLASIFWLPETGPSVAGAAAALPAGLAVGLLFAGLLRFARGKEQVTALLVCLPLVGWGLASAMHVSGPAVILLAGLVPAGDQTRRDLVSTCLREMHRPFLVAFLFLAGVWLPAAPRSLSAVRMIPTVTGGVFLVAGFILMRAAAWRLFRWPGLRPAHYVPLSPLALLLVPGLLSGREPPEMGAEVLAAVVLIAALVAGDVGWLVMQRAGARREKGGPR